MLRRRRNADAANALPKELAAYDAAIETIRCYPVGELDLGDPPVASRSTSEATPEQASKLAEEPGE